MRTLGGIDVLVLPQEFAIEGGTSVASVAEGCTWSRTGGHRAAGLWVSIGSNRASPSRSTIVNAIGCWCLDLSSAFVLFWVPVPGFGGSFLEQRNRCRWLRPVSLAPASARVGFVQFDDARHQLRRILHHCADSTSGVPHCAVLQPEPAGQLRRRDLLVVVVNNRWRSAKYRSADVSCASVSRPSSKSDACSRDR
jgi:hypothetical protein